MVQQQIDQPAYLKYLQHGGEMGRLIRNYNWADSVLGAPDTWPAGLLTTLGIMLNSSFPMVLWWGPELIQFYNDTYRPSLGNNGKHPKALGQRAENCWPEVWPVIEPLIKQVITGGESVWSENQLIPIYRNNKLEDVYWTFSYSKVPDENGEAAGVLAICNETTEQVKSYYAVQQANRELEQAIEAAELATWDLNPLTNNFVGNDRLKSWFGLPPDKDIKLDSALSIIIEEDRERVSAAIQQAIKNGSDGNYDIIYAIVNPTNQKKRIVKAIGKAIFDDEGNASRFSGTLQDVTDEYQLQQRKDEFISVASHELKTPITSLSASIQILQKLVKTDHASPNVPVFVDKANNNLNKLLRLLDDLLNVTKIQQGQLALHQTRFNLVELIKDCSEHIHLDTNHKININGDRELMVYGDYRRIDQVVVNLINNAIKYAPQSRLVDIMITHDTRMATVSVRDYGIGISPEKLPHLFDRYYRVDSLGHQFSGLGLGLYISSDIIGRHGGKIGVESTVGEGSRFWFTLPLEG